MNIKHLTLIAVIIILGLFIFKTNYTDIISDNELSVRKIQKDLDSGAVLLDVRTPAEYNELHAEPAINIPLSDIQDNSFGDLKKEQKIYVYCKSGNRSAQAIKILNQAGFTNTVDLKSLSYWQSLGGETK
jgi:phage shock protein E